MTEIFFGLNWPKVGNNFKKVHFLGKRRTVRKCLKKGLNEFKLKYKVHKKCSLEIFLSYEQTTVQILSLFCSHLSFEKRLKMRPNTTFPFPRK